MESTQGVRGFLVRKGNRRLERGEVSEPGGDSVSKMQTTRCFYCLCEGSEIQRLSCGYQEACLGHVNVCGRCRSDLHSRTLSLKAISKKINKLIISLNIK